MISIHRGEKLIILKSISEIIKNKETFGYINKDGDLVFPNDDEDKEDTWD